MLPPRILLRKFFIGTALVKFDQNLGVVSVKFPRFGFGSSYRRRFACGFHRDLGCSGLIFAGAEARVSERRRQRGAWGIFRRCHRWGEVLRGDPGRAGGYRFRDRDRKMG